MLASVAAGRTSIDPLGAGALLAGVLFGFVGLGALIGLAAGSVGIGIAIGAVIGIPAAIVSVYARYKDSI
jgi:hypothetical protein